MNHINTKISGTIVLILLSFNIGYGQLVSDSFTYSDGNLVGNGNWANFSGTSGQIQVSSGLITITDSNSEDARVTFTAQSSGTVYFGYDIKVTDPSSYSGTDYEYFCGFADNTTFENRVDIAAFSASGWKPGMSNTSSTAESVWASDLSYATTYRVVVGISISTGVSELWIDPSSTSSTKITGTGSQSVTEIDALYLRQSGATPNVSLTIDNLSISTDFDEAKTFPVAAVSDPTSFSTSVQSTSQINLTWTDNSNSDNVLLAWNSSSTFGTPTNGQTYSADDAISGGGTVLQYSSTDSYSHSSLTSNTAYYYKAWSYDGSDYSSGATTDATTLKVEPSNHPTSLSASSSYQSIEITWTDAVTGSQAPDGYLILGETDATITDPSDGTAVSDDTDATGNAVAKNVTHGSGASYTFSSLTASTAWYFEIFSYTNSGSEIDYKLDGTIQTANATTGVAPVFVINEIHADPDATSGDANGDATISTTNDEFVEIVNRSGYSVDISNWVISDGNSDRHVVTNGTTIGDGVALVVFGGGTPTNINGIVQTASTGALGLNNSSDDVTLKDDNGGTIVTYSYGSEGGDNQSIARNPDYTGDFVKHSTISGNAVLFSPGKTNAGDVSLPVELSSFVTNITRSDEITLIWVTESEIENLGFIVERRAVEIESPWIELADYTNFPELQGQGSVTSRTEYSFTDFTVESGQSYDYRLADVSFDGVKEYHHLYVLDVSPAALPTEYQLHQNYPNPFNPTTTISYTLPEESNVSLAVFDIQGREIITLHEAEKAPGSYEVVWNGLDQSGHAVSTGVYFCRLEAGSFTETIKMVYLR
jgi:hypothetical protein